MIHRLTVLKQDHRRDAPNPELFGGLRIFVDVDLHHTQLTRVFLSDFLKLRGQSLAGPTPFGPEIHEDGDSRVQDFSFEIGVIDGFRVCSHVFAPFFEISHDRIEEGVQKNQIKILLVDDDARFAQAIQEVISRAGYQAVHYRTAAEAVSNSKIHQFQAALIDCLLPKVSGVDLSLELRKMDPDLPIILTSGIFKDKTFIKDALKKSGAREFLSKPFDIQRLVQLLQGLLKPVEAEAMDPLREILLKDNPSPGERLSAVRATTHINGLEIPFVVGLVLHPSTNGQIKLTNTQGKVTNIFINEGRIVLVETPDPQSYFGVLLVEKGLLTFETIDDVLRQPNPNKKRIGERLVEANVLSPHQIKGANSEQMAIRLSRIISDQVFQIEFSDGKPTYSEGHLDLARFTNYLSDWIMSKYNINWFQSHYLAWANDSLVKSARFTPNHPAWQLPPLSSFPETKKKFDMTLPLADYLAGFGPHLEKAYQVLHLLMTLGFVHFAGVRKAVNSESSKLRLRRIAEDMKSQNDFEVLGLTTKTSAPVVKKSYHELSKTFHPDKLGPGTDPEIAKLTNEIFTRMTAAYNRLQDDTKRESYLKELEKGNAEKILLAESLYEEGRRLIHSGQGALAKDKLQKALSLSPQNSEINLHYLWARILTINEKNVQEILRECDENIGRVPPEDRHNALYFFVKGLFQKNLGDVKAASVNFQNAIGMQPEFVEAKRELNLLSLSAKSKNANKDLLKADLKDVVGMLFKRKK